MIKPEKILVDPEAMYSFTSMNNAMRKGGGVSFPVDLTNDDEDNNDTQADLPNTLIRTDEEDGDGEDEEQEEQTEE